MTLPFVLCPLCSPIRCPLLTLVYNVRKYSTCLLIIESKAFERSGFNINIIQPVELC